ncbi:hypothetical protein CDAR_279031 [Caerostris darwini]|uniref:Uncharacterized protein n=1 Tax=Caerostris darwini TaxID=1538125 RepID=A0AAV4U980_9ARAC|nr:hypothetical protein CDAR_279031 [Caerostris darwini]
MGITNFWQAMSGVGPDSRRSWVVAVACFFVQVLTFGLTEASGLLFVATIKRFDSRREEASLPFTLTYCIRSAIGPFCGYLGNRFGIRQVTLIGCILSAISVGLCFFANDILSLILLWGLVFGISLGLETSLLNVILNEHFVKHRVKANGLNISGASLGTLLLSPLIENAVEAYGLSGTFLIISGLMLNSIPAVAVMLLNKPTTEENAPPRKRANSMLYSKTSITDTLSDNKFIGNAILKRKRKENTINGCRCESYKKRNSETIENGCSPSIIIDVSQLKDSPTNTDGIQSTYQQWIMKVFHTPSTVHIKSYRIQEFDIPKKNIQNISSIDKQNILPIDKQSSITEKIPEDNLLQITSCLTNGECEKNHKSSKSSVPSVHISQNPSDQSSSKWEIHRLFCEPIYIILIIGSGIYYFSITTFLTVIVDHATDIGISLTYSTYLVMWIAASDMCGYFSLSWIIERGYLSQSQFAALSYLCVSLAATAIVYSTSYIMLLILITVFELGQCGVIILCAPIVAELIDEDLQATAIASVTILSSPITMAISPIIGYFRDGGGSYAGVFYVISASTFFCCLLFLCIPKLQRRRDIQRSKT